MPAATAAISSRRHARQGSTPRAVSRYLLCLISAHDAALPLFCFALLSGLCSPFPSHLLSPTPTLLCSSQLGTLCLSCLCCCDMRSVIAPTQTVFMCSQSRAAAAGVISVNMHFLLCTFHVYAAVIDYTDHKLHGKDATTLLIVMLLFKFVALGRTVNDVKERWKLCSTDILPTLQLGHMVEQQANQAGQPVPARITAREALDAYVKKEWLCPFWILAWTAAGVSPYFLQSCARTSCNLLVFMLIVFANLL